MVSFFDTFDCRSGRHCRTCRSRTTGHPFRSTIAAYFSLPSADFPCPHSRPWGLAGLPAPLPHTTPQPTEPALAEPRSASSVVPVTAAEAQRRFTICHACEHSRDNAFACALHPGCCFGKFRAVLANRCPAGRW